MSNDPLHRADVVRLYLNTGKGRPKGRPDKPRIMESSQGAVVVVGLGNVARKLRVSKGTLRQYHQRGVIPDNFSRSENGRRWYPVEFVEMLVPIFAEQRSRKDTYDTLRRRVKEVWRSARLYMPIVNPVLEPNHVEEDDD